MDANFFLGICIGFSIYVGLYFNELSIEKLLVYFVVFIMAFIGYLIKKNKSH